MNDKATFNRAARAAMNLLRMSPAARPKGWSDLLDELQESVMDTVARLTHRNHIPRNAAEKWFLSQLN